MHGSDLNARLSSLLRLASSPQARSETTESGMQRPLWISHAMHLPIRTSLKPKGIGSNDQFLAERLLNVATSLPFVFLGVDTLRKDRKSGRQLGVSLIAVGLTATSYHAASGNLRKVLRKLDYWSISVCSALLAHTMSPQAPIGGAVQLASLAMIPFQPTAVTAANTALLEVELARRSRNRPHMREAYRQHALAGVLGLACFALEDLALKNHVNVVHAAWHCLACLSMAKLQPLLQDWEHAQAQRKPRGRGRRHLEGDAVAVRWQKGREERGERAICSGETSIQPEAQIVF